MPIWSDNLGAVKWLKDGEADGTSLYQYFKTFSVKIIGDNRINV